MDGEADELDLGLELHLAAGGVVVLEPLHGHDGAVLQAALVHDSEASLAEDVLRVEVVRRRAELLEREPPQVPQLHLRIVLVCDDGDGGERERERVSGGGGGGRGSRRRGERRRGGHH